ncbi:MAG: DUF5678 domain-containing protein [Chloroflexota bacterium]
MEQQITLTIPGVLYRRAERLAQATNRQVAEVLAEAIVLDDALAKADTAEEDAAVERETVAYAAMHSKLLQEYNGEYVAIHQGQLVDHDENFAALYGRVDDCYPNAFVLVRQVELDPVKVYRFRSPRFATNGDD